MSDNDRDVWVAGSHHILVVEHLGSQFGDCQSTVNLGATGSEWGKSGNVEVHTWEGLEVDIQLTEIGVELTWEAEAGGDSRHNQGDEVVKVSIGWAGELEGTEADIVQSLVVDGENFVGRLNQLVDGQGCVVWLNDGVGHLW